MNPDHVFVISACGGQWEDSWERPIAACPTKEVAEKLVEEKEQEDYDLRARLYRIIEDRERKGKHTIDFDLMLDGMVTFYRINCVEFIGEEWLCIC